MNNVAKSCLPFMLIEVLLSQHLIVVFWGKKHPKKKKLDRNIQRKKIGPFTPLLKYVTDVENVILSTGCGPEEVT